LLRDLKVTRPNQVWCTDITDNTDITGVPMAGGQAYLGP
jgi:hypothetical protein